MSCSVMYCNEHMDLPFGHFFGLYQFVQLNSDVEWNNGNEQKHCFALLWPVLSQKNEWKKVE